MTTTIIICILGILCLLSEIVGFKKLLLPLVFVGLTLALIFSLNDWNTNNSYFNDMVVFDNYALAFTSLIILLSIIWFIISPPFFIDTKNESDHYSLIIFSLIGGVIMTAFNNMIMLFLGIEILSISLYVLAGSNKSLLSSNEAALKYFLMGAFATGFLLFGITLIYGQTASFNLMEIAHALASNSGNKEMIYTGIFMIMIAMSFKVSVVPFHFWAPDVYQGSPTVITAFMSTAVKTAAFAAFLRLFITSFKDVEPVWSSTLLIISAATILIGNITAVYQTNFKRMLAYSSISHAGYMLLAILSMNNMSSASLLFYTLAYSFSSITSFAVLLLVNKSTGNESIESFNGLARRNPLFATVVIIAMLSLAGIPPTAGFFAKYYIFSAAIQNNLTGLVLIALAGSLIGVFYYFKIIIALFRDKETPKMELNTGFKMVLIITSIVTMVLGILPGLVADLL